MRTSRVRQDAGLLGPAAACCQSRRMGPMGRSAWPPPFGLRAASRAAKPSAGPRGPRSVGVALSEVRRMATSPQDGLTDRPPFQVIIHARLPRRYPARLAVLYL